jgi:basic amino acid/polyamine antiporter, APA family
VNGLSLQDENGFSRLLMTTPENPKYAGLVRGLGLWAATAVVVGSMIGQAIFLVPGDVARELGSQRAAMLCWTIGGFVALFGILCYAELGAAIPEAGGAYVYLSRGLSPLWGFLYGWTSTMIMRPASAATIAAGLLRFATFLLPPLSAPIFIWHIWIPFQSQPYQFSFTLAQSVAAGMIVLVTVINYFGVRAAGRFQILLSSLKVAAVAALVILGLTLAGKSCSIQPLLEPSSHYSGLGAFLSALVPVMVAYNGFSVLGEVGGEIINPRKNFPRAAIIGVLVVVSLYLLINWVYLHVLGLSRVAHSQHVASDAMSLLLGTKGAEWMTLGMIVSAFGSLHVNFLGGPRVPYAMARDGVFFSFAKRVQPRFHTPSGAVIFQGCVAILLVLTGSYQEIYSLGMFAISASFAMTALALIRLRSTEAELTRPYRVWGYPWTVLAFGAASFAISMNLWLVRPVRSSIGLTIILLGVPFFRRWRGRASSSIAGTGTVEVVSVPLTKNFGKT